MLAHTYAGGGDQQVALAGGREVMPQALPASPRNAEVDRMPTGQADQRGQGMGIRACDLPPGEDLVGLIHVHDLIAASQDRHPRPAIHQGVGDRERGEHAEFGGAKLGTMGKGQVALAEVFARLPPVDTDIAILCNRHDRPCRSRCLPAG